MVQQYITRGSSDRLLLFFAGWGMDETPFLSICPEGKDFMICYDYRSLSFDAFPLQAYREVTLVAWSMGVWAASQVVNSSSVDYSIAINGTPYPVHETMGIAPAILKGTLDGLNEQTLQKFQRRMCGGAEAYRDFQTVAPRRSVNELKEELACIECQSLDLPPATFVWQEAFVGTADRIFLPYNQLRAWQTTPHTTVRQVEVAHYQRELFRQVFSMEKQSELNKSYE